MVANPIRNIMKGQNKHKGSSLVFCLFLLIFASGCNSEKRQKGYFWANYYYTHDGVVNMELYKIENYDFKKSIQENLEKIDRVKCFVTPYSEYDHNYQYVQQLIEIREKNKFKRILCKVDFEIADTNALLYHSIGSDSVKFDSFTIKCDYYFLSTISDKIIFHHFEPIESVILK